MVFQVFHDHMNSEGFPVRFYNYVNFDVGEKLKIVKMRILVIDTFLDMLFCNHPCIVGKDTYTQVSLLTFSV